MTTQLSHISQRHWATKSLLGLIALLSAIFTENLYAAIILHDEAISGDMSFFSPPSFTSLPIGQYRISGSISYAGGCVFSLPPPCISIDDLDAFIINGIPADRIVKTTITASLILTMPDSTSSNITNISQSWMINSDFLSWSLESIDNPTTISTTITPSAFGSYFFQTQTGSLNYEGPELQAGDFIDMNYSILIDVLAVPLPGAMWLLLSGLIPLATFANHRASRVSDALTP